MLESTDTPTKDKSPTKAFASKSSYGKAVAKVKRNLPFSPSKRRAVVHTLATQITPEIMTTKHKTPKTTISVDTVEKVKNFYVRDDISRQNPGIKDTKIVPLEDGKKVKIQNRNLFSNFLETYALFCDEFGTVIGKSKFAELRPKYVLLSCQTPENVCLCKYHENYILAVNVLSKNCNDIPGYDKTFLTKTALCKAPTASCWYDKCTKCKTMMQSKLEKATSLIKDREISWYEWKEENGRLRKVLLKGTVSMLCEHILKMTPQFKEHSYTKREQAQCYNQDRIDCMSSDCNFALLQVDFPENYTCVSQDEIQSYHWVQPQVPLITVSLWFNQKQHAFTICSDNLHHNKDTVIVYIDRILTEIPEDVKEVRIWSDGPSSQFENRFIANSLPISEKRHNLKITWNFSPLLMAKAQ